MRLRITHAFEWLKHPKDAVEKFRRDMAASWRFGAAAVWAPVAFGCGVLCYFALPFEPPANTVLWIIAGALTLSVGAYWLLRGQVQGWRWFFAISTGIALVGLGFGASALRTQAAAAPILNTLPAPVAFDGWVERDDVGPRLRRVVLTTAWVEGFAKADMPRRIQIAAPERSGVAPGRYVSCFGRLTAPPAPVTPGGYDFARSAYFTGVGASGYALRACEPAVPPRARSTGERIRSWLAAERRSITNHILGATSGGSAAGFVAALATGDESAIGQDDIKAMQSAGLTHLLAVSGMNMTLVGGFAFLLVRTALSVAGPLPLYVPIRSIAAVAALAACAFYWALTGGGAATGRAFIMAAVAFGAIVIGRPAITMRGLAIAALVLLIAMPESLMSPGFQMSFAATMALVAAFEIYKERRVAAGPDGEFKWVHAAPRAVFAAALTSFVAGAATAPYSAYHFQTFATYGFAANLAATPLIGLIVIPACMIALLLAPFGLADIPLLIAEWGSQRILDLASWISAQPDAIGAVPAFHPIWLLFATAGLLSLCLLHGLAKLTAPVFFSIAWLGISLSPKPLMIISADTTTILAKTPSGVVRSSGPATSFEQTRFRQAMGAGPDEVLEMIERKALATETGYVLRLRDAGLFLMQNEAAAKPTCLGRKAIVLTPKQKMSARCRNQLTLTPEFLAREGGGTIYATKDNYRMETVQQRRGERPWTKAN
ncbi:MAG: ComEC/Rec2 family competence protein [Caulobacterales bacterium]